MYKRGANIICTDPKPRKPLYYEVIKVSSDSLPFDNNTFDIIYSSNVLEHIQNLSNSLREMRRLLKASGIMIHSVPTISCSVLTTISYPFNYFIRIIEVFKRYYNMENIFKIKIKKNLYLFNFVNNYTWLLWFIRFVQINLKCVNPISIFRTNGHGIAKNPIDEIRRWKTSSWVDKFHDNGLYVVQIIKHPISFSMNKLIGKLFLGMRKRIARIGISGDKLYILKIDHKQ